MLGLFTPDYRIDSVLDLDARRLRRMGLDAILLDVDCTLKSYREVACTPEVVAWLEQLRAEGIGVCLVSNGCTARIGPFAEALRFPCVPQAFKPLPRGIRRAVELLGCNPARTAMIGDQLFADVVAAHLAGIASILVVPIRPHEEPWFTRLKRQPERFLLWWMRRKLKGLVFGDEELATDAPSLADSGPRAAGSVQ
jgi:hypothetical protein